MAGTIITDTDKRVVALANDLDIEACFAIGLVESLRLFSETHGLRGFIGKYSNEDIAQTIGYTEDPDRLVNALLASGCVGGDPSYRLQIRCFYWKGDKRRRRLNRIKAAGGESSPALRAEIMARDGYSCRQCEAVEDLTLDHILPVSAGGKTDRNNLQVLCRPCNARKKDTVFHG